MYFDERIGVGSMWFYDMTGGTADIDLTHFAKAICDSQMIFVHRHAPVNFVNM